MNTAPFMPRPRPPAPCRHSLVTRRRGFTLIELIGVLAIIAILATILTPNVLRSIDRAAIEAEYETMHRLGAQVELFLRERGTLPGQATPSPSLNPPVQAWAQDLGAFSDLSPYDIDRNRRGQLRLLLREPPSSNPRPARLLLLSRMRNDTGLALPTAPSLAQFDEIWRTADGTVPAPPYSWSGWAAWQNHGESLVIERVNLAITYATQLKTFTVKLNNTSPGDLPASYVVTDAQGNRATSALPAGWRTVDLAGLARGTQLTLCLAAGGANPDYSYVVTDPGCTFDFDGTQWIPR